MAAVRVGLSYTRNLGNFENTRVHVEIEDTPRKKSNGEEENVRELFDRVYGFTEAKLIEKVTALEEEISHTEQEVRTRKGK